MRQAHLLAPRTIAWIECDTPQPRRGEMLVRIRAALTCGTDLKTYRRGHPKLKYGPFGHEASGDVIAVGRGVDRFAPGDAVMWVHTAPCGECAACRAGRENLCERLFEEVALGAYGDMLVLPAHVVARNVYPKPPGLSYIEAAFLEPLSCVVHGWKVLGSATGGVLRAGNGVAIIGAGTIGLLHLWYARRAGLNTSVIARGTAPKNAASALGAARVVDAGDDDAIAGMRDRFAAAIECAGTPEAWKLAPGLVAPQGRVLYFAGLAANAEVPVDATRLHYGELVLLGAFHFTPGDVRDAAALLREMRPGEFRPLISGVEPLESLSDAFARLDRRDGYKYALIPGAGGHMPAWV